MINYHHKEMKINPLSRCFFRCRYLLLKILILVFLTNITVFVFANNNSAKDVLIIIPKQVRPYQSIVNSIKREFRLKRKTEKIKILDLNKPRSASQHVLKGNKLVITIGAKSLDYYLRTAAQTPFLASFITESAFASLSRKVAKKDRLRGAFVGGISLEQPSYRLASLVKLIENGIQSVGVVLGPNSLKKRVSLQKQIARFGGKLKVAEIRASDNPVKKLRTVFENSQIVIVIPDKADFNRNLARWIVTLSYKYKVPVVSYSRKYADAGALISLYSQPRQIGMQTAKMALSYLNQPRTRSLKLVAPEYFQIHINQSVNQAFGLRLPNKDVFLRNLYSTEP